MHKEKQQFRPFDSLILLFIAFCLVVIFHWQGNTADVHLFGRSVFVWMVTRWSDYGGQYSHCWLIPLVSLGVLYCKRQDLIRARKNTSVSGLFIIVASLLLQIVSSRTRLPRLSLVAFVGLLWSIPYAFLGKKVARILVFPCAYLLFCIPLTFLDTLTFPLRLIAASTATGIVNGIGIGAVRYGTAILSVPPGSFQLDVADPCSGLRSFLAMVSLTAAYAYFSQKSFVGKWVLFLCSPLIAIASNIVRIVAIAVVAFAVGQETATGFYHDYSPYIVFASAVLFMTGLGSLLNRLSTINSPVDSVTSSDKKHKVDFQIKTGTTIIVLLVSTSLTLHMMGDVKLSSESGVTSSLPAFVGDYTAEGILFCQDLHCGKSIPETMPTENRHCPACGGVVDYVSPIEKNMLPSDTVILRKRYRNSYGKTYAVTIVISGKERTSIHRPQMCLTGQGHQIVRERCVKVPVQEKQIEVMFLDLKRQVSASGSSGGQTASSVYAYWFIGGDRETASHWKRTFLTAYDNIFRGTSPRWAYVAIMTSRTAHPTNDNEQLKYFISELYPGIRDDHSGE